MPKTNQKLTKFYCVSYYHGSKNPGMEPFVKCLITLGFGKVVRHTNYNETESM